MPLSLPIWLALPAITGAQRRAGYGRTTRRVSWPGFPPSAGFSACGADQRSGSGSSMRTISIRFSSARTRQAFESPRAFSQSQLTDKHDTMLYLFSGPDFLYATVVFPERLDLRPGRPRAGRRHSAIDQPVASGASTETLHNLRILAGIDSELQLLHHQKYEDAIERRAGLRNAAGPVCVPGAHRQNHPRGQASSASIRRATFKIWRAAETAAKLHAKHRAPHKGVKIVFSDGNGPQPDALLFQHQSLRRRRRAKRLSGILRQARSGRQLHQKRVLSAARRRLQQGAQFPAAITAPPSSRTTAAFRSPISIAKKWHLQPFGRYVGPLGIFGHSYQPGMAELFRNATPLDFGIGYRWREE